MTYQYGSLNTFGQKIPQAYESEYAPGVPRFNQGKPFAGNFGMGQETSEASSMNYGGYNGTDLLSNFLDGNQAYGTTQAPGMLDSMKSWYGENKGTLFGDKNAPGLIPMGVGLGTNIMNTYLGMQNYGLAKQSMQDARDRYASDYAAQKTVVNNQIADREASKAGSGGMTRAEAMAYGEKRAKEIGVV